MEKLKWQIQQENIAEVFSLLGNSYKMVSSQEQNYNYYFRKIRHEWGVLVAEKTIRSRGVIYPYQQVDVSIYDTSNAQKAIYAYKNCTQCDTVCGNFDIQCCENNNIYVQESIKILHKYINSDLSFNEADKMMCAEKHLMELNLHKINQVDKGRVIELINYL
ncbi:MAG: hypothetical protein RBQ97_10485 [Acholeplasma sp.]|jgi:hypothetical protein|nr:hypothetical protein [Acholeplasma sp.]